MLCKIADLLAEIPEDHGLAERCRDYATEEKGQPDLVIRAEQYRTHAYQNGETADFIAYMESGFQFYKGLLRFDGMMLHASAVELEGRAYLFSGPCGMGKSTHVRLWQKVFGEKAIAFNDDKPALRCLDGTWYAYGTPWCGKDGIQQNRKVPVAGICFLKQADHNRIRPLTWAQAVERVMGQTMRRRLTPEQMSQLLSVMDSLIRSVPMFELENRPEPAAVRLSHDTMCLAQGEEK